jgi:transcriptional regulator with XRE-family HTH domain
MTRLMDVREQFGLNLQRLRRTRHLSQEQLAAESGIDRAYIGRLERGEGNATLVTLERLATCLKVTVADLVREVRKSK